MSSKLKVLQVIPELGYGGAETGCYDLAHYLHEQNCPSFLVTSGGALTKYIDKKIVFKIIRIGFLLLTGKRKIFTLSLLTYLSNCPPEVAIKESQFFSCK